MCGVYTTTAAVTAETLTIKVEAALAEAAATIAPNRE